MYFKMYTDEMLHIIEIKFFFFFFYCIYVYIYILALVGFFGLMCHKYALKLFVIFVYI